MIFGSTDSIFPICNRYKHVVVVAQVDVGDFLRFKSCVLYTQLDNPEQPLVNVEVVAHVTRPELRKSEVTIPESHSVLPWITLFALHKLHSGLSFFFSRFNACWFADDAVQRTGLQHLPFHLHRL